MRDIWVKAEWWAWVTYEAYLNAARHSPGLTRDDRAVNLRKARDYKRRAIRVSQRLNTRVSP